MDGAGGRVHLIVDQCQVAVSKNCLVVHRIGDDFKRVLRLVLADFVELVGRHIEADEDRLDLGNNDKAGILPGLHEIANIHHALSGASGDRRADQGVVHVELGALDLRLIRL